MGKRAAYVAVANDIIDVGNVANFKRAAFACFCVVAKANYLSEFCIIVLIISLQG